MDTVNITINGRELAVEKGKMVLQAAIENGIELPYYCYHPGLGVDGSCRVCIVKIEKMPKLQTSCSTVCTEGMVVHTQTPDVVEARAGVFEFLLINHPLDCPVCDKGGECPLQDFSYSFGPNESRMQFPRRVFDGEGVRADVDFGPTLMLNRIGCGARSCAPTLARWSRSTGAMPCRKSRSTRRRPAGQGQSASSSPRTHRS